MDTENKLNFLLRRRKQLASLVEHRRRLLRSSSSEKACLNTVNDNNQEQYFLSNSADKTDDSVDEIDNSDEANIKPIQQSLIIKVPKIVVSRTKASFKSPLKAKENINQVPSKNINIISDIIVKPAYQQQDIGKQATKETPCARVDFENNSPELSKNILNSALQPTWRARAVSSQCANTGEEVNFSPGTSKDIMDSLPVLTCQIPVVSPSIITDAEINIFPETKHDLPDSIPQLTCLKPVLLPSVITDFEINTFPKTDKDSIPELTCLTPVLLPSVITDVEMNVYPGTSKELMNSVPADTCLTSVFSPSIITDSEVNLFPGTSETTPDDVFHHTYRAPSASVIIDIEMNVSPRTSRDTLHTIEPNNGNTLSTPRKQSKRRFCKIANKAYIDFLSDEELEDFSAGSSDLWFDCENSDDSSVLKKGKKKKKVKRRNNDVKDDHLLQQRFLNDAIMM